MMRRIQAVGVALILLMAGVAVPTGPAAAQAAGQTSTLMEVQQRGIMRVGVRNDIPHFGYTDEAGKIVGFEIDLTEEIAKRLGVKAELIPVTAATRIPMLMQKRVDLLVASLSHYRKRNEQIDFTIAYLRDRQSLLVKAASGIHDVGGLKGKRLGTNMGSGTAETFQKMQPETTVQTFSSWPDAFLALQQGLIDAVGTDMVLLAGLRASAPKPEDYVVLGKEGSFSSSDYGIGVRQDDSKWRNKLNFVLQDIWKDGTWDRIFDQWLGSKSKLKLVKAELGFDMPYWQD